MNIQFKSFPSHAISLFKERVLLSCTAQQKIILLIASIAFSILAAWFVASRFCFTAKQLNGEEKKTIPDGAVAEGEFKAKELQEEIGLQLNEEYSLNQIEQPQDESEFQQIKKNEVSQPLTDDLEDEDFLLSLWDLFAELDTPIVKPSADSQIKQEEDTLTEMLEKEIAEEKHLAIDKPPESIQTISPPPLKEEILMQKAKVVPPAKVHQTQMTAVPKVLLPLSPKEEMIKTFQSVWQHASPCERDWIKNLGQALIRKAEVIKWEKSGDSNEYSLEISNELYGTHSNLHIGKLVMKQKMKIAFSEEKLLESWQHRKMITFPDKGLCHKMGWGYFSKETSLERIIIEEHQEVLCTLEAFGKTVVENPILLLDFLNEIQWSS